MQHRAYELMRRYPDLCLNGYRVGRYSTKNSPKELKSPHLDQAISIICEFVGYLGMKGCLTRTQADVLDLPTTGSIWLSDSQHWKENVTGLPMVSSLPFCVIWVYLKSKSATLPMPWFPWEERQIRQYVS